ncbi:ionotropic receptor 75a-like isoform X1 [Vespula maculifrons]|uniref:Ionotropic receptor 75a-like isoform X1 n=1 Tax=Vespula maculifrons TaxID=7453 RepID=A0ABD2CHM9_VESMC|nr:ionotropic receptor 75a-like [Vespula vulgaris]
MISGLIAISIIAILCTAKANIAVTFTKEYFSEKYIQYLVVFGCWNSFDKMNFFRRDLLNNLTISYVPIKDNIEINTILKVNYYKLGIILDIDCPQSEIILEQFDENRLSYNESFFWLMITESNAVPIDFLRDLPLSIASEITVALRQKDVYVLYDVYNFSHRHGGRLNVTYMGYWSFDDGLRNELTQYKYKRRQNFHKLTLNVSIHVDHEPIPDFHTYILNPINRHVDTMMRYNYILIVQLMDYYNITMNLIRGTTWGYLVNGTWNGILADMIRGTVDISATPYLFKPERFDACDYTVQTYIAKTAIIFRHPKTSDIHNVFLMPFTEDVWYLILIVAIIYWLTLLLTVKIELYFDNYPKMCTLDTNPTSETALITAAAICQQGLSDGPRIYSGRIVFLSLFLWGLLLIQFYSASVVGSLLSEPPRFIHTLKNLSDSSLEVGIEDMAYNYDYLAKSTNPAVHELNRKKIQSSKKRGVEPFLTAEEGLKKVKRGGYAFHVDIATAYKIIEDTFSQDEICDLEEIQLFPVERIATAIRKHSPFKKMVTYGLRKMMEHGMGGHLSYIWQPARPQCPEGHNEIPAPVALNEFSPALFSLFMGIAVALFVMLIEMYIEHRKRRRQRILLEPLEVFSNSGISDLEQFDFHKIEPND